MSTAPVPQPDKIDALPDNWTRPFLRSVYSEKDGTGSFSRFGTQEVIAGCIVAVIILALAAYKASDAKTQMILTALPLIITAMAAWCGTLYGLNQWGKPKDGTSDAKNGSMSA